MGDLAALQEARERALRAADGLTTAMVPRRALRRWSFGLVGVGRGVGGVVGVWLGARLTAYASRYAVLERQGKREMPRWIALAVPVSGVSDADQEAQTVTEFEGSPEEAEKVLLQAAHTYGHTIRKVRRREIFEASKRSYFIRLQNRLTSYGFLIQLAELVHDSDTEDQDSHAA